jgi:hypothetical protein
MTAFIPSFQRYYLLPPNHCHLLANNPNTYHFFLLHIYLSIFTPIFKPPYLPQSCHCHHVSGTILTAVSRSFQWYQNHCHPTTATRLPTTPQPTCHFFAHLFVNFYTFFQIAISPPILPLPLSNWYHSNRLHLLFPTVTLTTTQPLPLPRPTQPRCLPPPCAAAARAETGRPRVRAQGHHAGSQNYFFIRFTD